MKQEFIWIATYNDDREIREMEQGVEGNFHELDFKNLKSFALSNFENKYEIDCRTGRFYMNGRAIDIPKCNHYFHREVGYGEGIIHFKRAYSEFNPETREATQGIQYYVLGWERKIDGQTVQLVLRIDAQKKSIRFYLNNHDLSFVVK